MGQCVTSEQQNSDGVALEKVSGRSKVWAAASLDKCCSFLVFWLWWICFQIQQVLLRGYIYTHYSISVFSYVRSVCKARWTWIIPPILTVISFEASLICMNKTAQHCTSNLESTQSSMYWKRLAFVSNYVVQTSLHSGFNIQVELISNNCNDFHVGY